VQVAPHTPDTWIALVQGLVRSGKRPDAETVATNAQRKLPEDRVLFTSARCQEVLGNLDGAEQLFSAAVEKQPRDFLALFNIADFLCRADQAVHAELYLRKLINPDTAAPAEHVGWARRQLALMLAFRGEAGDYQEAMNLLRRNIGAWGGSVADGRTRALVMGTNKEERARAVELFEASLQRQGVDDNDQFQLARLYDLAGEEAKARDWILGLLANRGDNPQYLAFFVHFLVKHEQTADALLYLNRLVALEPHSQRTHSAQAAVQKAQSSGIP
jgi:tetratricopeptide (TPR) repeat protein